MNIEEKGFVLDNKIKEELNARLLLAIFKILYEKNQISKKEYKLLISSVCRTFNIVA